MPEDDFSFYNTIERIGAMHLKFPSSIVAIDFRRRVRPELIPKPGLKKLQFCQPMSIT